eukprot:CAMPEP_0204277574 /NCGR_PEP_ID=MMETSP0468-20130131/29383_1 /ASSEMBLY_ACC=CAM_ASM_000383 /TAXON_ID=2969 /ORGANISM="Oxyrrhis marina" /LENGTH=745 /DNA_ID=CAMNT_0051254383 /DNA_START=53 /DNA_END=2290 /DNA_ORIENTATION=+
MSVPQQMSKDQLNKWRTRSCERYKSDGICVWGPECQYSHSLLWCRRPLSAKVDYAPRLCTEVVLWLDRCAKVRMESTCKAGDHCKFAHSAEEVLFHPSNYKTKMCDVGGKKCCRYYCPFAHGRSDLRRKLHTSLADDDLTAMAEMLEDELPGPDGSKRHREQRKRLTSHDTRLWRSLSGACRVDAPHKASSLRGVFSAAWQASDRHPVLECTATAETYSTADLAGAVARELQILARQPSAKVAGHKLVQCISPKSVVCVFEKFDSDLLTCIEASLHKTDGFLKRLQGPEGLGTIEWQARRRISDLFGGLAHLHSLNVVHGSLQPRAVAVDYAFRFKITRLSMRPEDGEASDAALWAPLAEGMSKEADVFALGCLVCYMMSGDHPFGCFRTVENVRELETQKAACIPAKIVGLYASPMVTDLVLRCTIADPRLRPSPRDVVQHPCCLPFPELRGKMDRLAATQNPDLLRVFTTARDDTARASCAHRAKVGCEGVSNLAGFLRAWRDASCDMTSNYDCIDCLYDIVFRSQDILIWMQSASDYVQRHGRLTERSLRFLSKNHFRFSGAPTSGLYDVFEILLCGCDGKAGVSLDMAVSKHNLPPGLTSLDQALGHSDRLVHMLSPGDMTQVLLQYEAACRARQTQQLAYQLKMRKLEWMLAASGSGALHAEMLRHLDHTVMIPSDSQDRSPPSWAAMTPSVTETPSPSRQKSPSEDDMFSPEPWSLFADRPHELFSAAARSAYMDSWGS